MGERGETPKRGQQGQITCPLKGGRGGGKGRKTVKVAKGTAEDVRILICGCSSSSSLVNRDARAVHTELQTAPYEQWSILAY